MARKALDTWIQEAMLDEDKDGPLTALSLVHMVGQQKEELHTTKLGGGKKYVPLELANLFRGKADTFSQDLPTAQTFILLAFYGGRTQPEGQYLFIVPGNSELSGLSTEGPTPTGFLQQAMRLSEMVFTQTYRRQQLQDEVEHRRYDALARENYELRNENRDCFRIFKEMLLEKALNDHNRQIEIMRVQQSAEDRTQLMKIAPALVNTIAGREVFPQATADTAIIEAVAEAMSKPGIDSNALVALTGNLPPHVQGLLMQRMTQILEKQNQEREARKMMAPHPDPEADAGGEG